MKSGKRERNLIVTASGFTINLERLFYSFCRLLALTISAMVASVTVLHRDRTARTGGWLLAANHISHFDPIVIAMKVHRRVDWMAMSELFTTRLGAAFFRAGGAFPTDRSRIDRRAVRETLHRLQHGRVVGIFPEGGIRTGRESVLAGAPLRPGVAMLSRLAKVPIIPCVILGSDTLYHPRRWLPFRRNRLWIAFGEPLDVSPISPDLPPRLAYQELDRALRAAFTSLYAELCDTCHLRPEDLPTLPQE